MESADSLQCIIFLLSALLGCEISRAFAFWKW